MRILLYLLGLAFMVSFVGGCLSVGIDTPRTFGPTISIKNPSVEIVSDGFPNRSKALMLK